MTPVIFPLCYFSKDDRRGWEGSQLETLDTYEQGGERWWEDGTIRAASGSGGLEPGPGRGEAEGEVEVGREGRRQTDR